MGSEQGDDKERQPTTHGVDTASDQDGEAAENGPQAMRDVSVDSERGLGEKKPSRNPRGRPKGSFRSSRKLPQAVVADIVAHVADGFTGKEVAEKFRISEIAVDKIKQRYAPVFDRLKDVVDYRAIKSDLLDSASLVTLESIVCPRRQETANLSELAKTFDVLNRHSRLEQGLSTDNKAVRSEVTIRRLPPKPTDQ